MQRHAEHVDVGDAGTADRLTVLACGLVPVEGPLADVFTLHAGHCRAEREHRPGRIVFAAELTGEELQADSVLLECLGECDEVGAAAEALVLVDDESHLQAGRAQFASELDGLGQLGAGLDASAELLGEDPADVGVAERVQLVADGLSRGGGAGVSDADAPRLPRRPWLLLEREGFPSLSGLALRGSWDAELLLQLRHQPEAGGVVLDRYATLGCPAGGAGGGVAGGHRVVALLDEDVLVGGDAQLFHGDV